MQQVESELSLQTWSGLSLIHMEGGFSNRGGAEGWRRVTCQMATRRKVVSLDSDKEWVKIACSKS